MIKLKEHDRVSLTETESLGTVTKVINDESVLVRFDEDRDEIKGYMTNLTLIDISLDRFAGMTSDEQLEYIRKHPELTRQWTVSWIGIDDNGKIRYGMDRLGAIQTLIEHPDASDGILAETFYGILREEKYFLNTMTILNFWEVKDV